MNDYWIPNGSLIKIKYASSFLRLHKIETWRLDAKLNFENIYLILGSYPSYMEKKCSCMSRYIESWERVNKCKPVGLFFDKKYYVFATEEIKILKKQIIIL